MTTQLCKCTKLKNQTDSEWKLINKTVQNVHIIKSTNTFNSINNTKLNKQQSIKK